MCIFIRGIGKNMIQKGRIVMMKVRDIIGVVVLAPIKIVKVVHIELKIIIE
jgi:hypothetical protein